MWEIRFSLPEICIKRYIIFLSIVAVSIFSSLKFAGQYPGLVSIHFDDIKKEISNMKTFISECILVQSVEYMEYVERTKRKNKDNLIFHLYLVTGISNWAFAFNSSFRQVALLFYSCLITFLQRKASLLSLPMNV